ncbi:MAG: hypothetical protein MJ252_13520 [archaeon]|nr:hypothetical protein [archaeon]
MFQNPMMQMEQPLDQEEDNIDCLKLFIGGLNYLSMQSDIRSYFETFGEVVSCSLLQDKATSKSRGFAFVTLRDPDNSLSEKILSRKHEINGKIVDVKPAVEGKKREEMLDSSKKVFVGGLDPSVNNDDLKNYFSHYGTVKEACVLFDNNRGASRCFGFVTFEEKETVEKLVKTNNYCINGKKIDVKQAMPKSIQGARAVKCQSAVDTMLSKHKRMDGDFHKGYEDEQSYMEMMNK